MCRKSSGYGCRQTEGDVPPRRLPATLNGNRRFLGHLLIASVSNRFLSAVTRNLQDVPPLRSQLRQ
jgi:hypothetical protein